MKHTELLSSPGPWFVIAALKRAKGATGRKLPCPIQIRCEKIRVRKISQLVETNTISFDAWA